VKGNTSFTAYVTDGEPELVESSQPHIIERNLIIPDDHKEYWGFYLLKGSTFRIQTCARYKNEEFSFSHRFTETFIILRSN